MMWINIKRILRTGFIKFWRNSVVAIASVLVMVITLFIIGSLILANVFLNDTLNNIKERVDISVSFKTDAPEGEIMALKSSLELLPEVKEVKYSSREKELEDFISRHKDNALLIKSLEEVGNPFGARLSVMALDPSHYDSLARFLESHNEVGMSGGTIIDQIIFKRDIVNRLLSIISISQKISLAVSIFLVLISILVTFNTISLAIYISRDEISVMRLVGGNNWYIRGPFLVEGLLSGVIASFIALILLYPGTIWLSQMTTGVYGGVNLFSYYKDSFGFLFLTLLVTGAFLGVSASFLAIRKYLKV